MTTPRTIQRYGWTPDLPDHRDFLFRCVHAAPVTLPSSVDLSPAMPPVFDQGALGSCTANAIAALDAYVQKLEPRSRLEIYYEERKIEGTIHQDSGAQIRDGMKVLGTLGAGAETLWPYDIAKFTHAPPKAVLADGRKHRDASYSRLVTRADFRDCLAAGFPFVIGFTVYDAFEGEAVAKTGVVNLPGDDDRAIGGHAICVYGYDTAFQASAWAAEARAKGVGEDDIPADVYMVRNSWGGGWGRGGNFAVDARYFENPNLADDAWTLRAVG